MTLFSNDEGVEDFEKMLIDVKIDEKNMYISNSNKAVDLLAKILDVRHEQSKEESMRQKIRQEVNELFKLFSDVSLDNELVYFKRFQNVCDRLSERAKLKKLEHKTVISLGGKFSSGKSKFINSIAQLNGVLPEAQNPTTSIPTYIVYGEKEQITANSIFNYMFSLDQNTISALTHEFYDKYKIGFSQFIESIVVQSPSFALNHSIVLLDTPGYSKYDSEIDVSANISDRQKAFEQLKITDYLIWLVDIENGEITIDDIEFIESLKIDTPILFVFNKADKVNEGKIKEILNKAHQTVHNYLPTKCFAITAYSSRENKEYGGNFINTFFQSAANSQKHNNDIFNDLLTLERDIRKSIECAKYDAQNVAKVIFKYISYSENVMEISSLSKLWSVQNQDGYLLYRLLQDYDDLCARLNKKISKYLRGDV